MAGQRKDPFRSYRFRVEIDGMVYGFSDATGFESTVDVVDYREGSDPTHFRKLSGLTKYSNITLKWGNTDSLDLYKWYKSVIDGDIQRKNMSITVLDEMGNDKSRWEIEGAWPTKYKAPDFNAKGNEIAVESLEIVHEGITRVK